MQYTQTAMFLSYLCENDLRLQWRQPWATVHVGAAVAKWLSSWLAEQEGRGSIPGLATWIFRDWLSPASKSRYGWKIAKSTLILKTTNQATVHVDVAVSMRPFPRKYDSNMPSEYIVFTLSRSI